MDDFKIKVINALGYFKLFECGKKLFDNLDTTYKCACISNAKGNY